METYTINYKGEKIEITSIDSVNATDEDLIHSGLSNNHFEDENEINAEVEGCNYFEGYYTKQTAVEEFESFKNLDNSHVIDETTIEVSRTQDELGRKEYMMGQILADSTMDLEDELTELQEMPENFINSVYETSYDEMTSIEASECVEYIKVQLNAN